MIWALLVVWLAVLPGRLATASDVLLHKLGLPNGSVIVVHSLPPASSDGASEPSKQSAQWTPASKISQDLAALPIFINADRVSKMLRNFANEEMATYFLQSRFDHIGYQVDSGSYASEVGVLADALAVKLEECVNGINAVRKHILSVFIKSPYDMRTFKQYRECCSIDPQHLRHSTHYGAQVNGSISCDVVPKGLSAFSFYPGQNLTNVFLSNVQNHPSILKQFFISSDGLRTEYPASRLDLHNYTNCEYMALKNRREIFSSIAFPYPKKVVIFIQRGMGMSAKYMRTAKCVAKALLDCLTADDEVFIFAASNKLLMPSNLYCLNATVAATAEVRAELEQFVDALSADSEYTNHMFAMTAALSVFENSWPSSGGKARQMLFYISLGLQFQMGESQVQLNDIISRNAQSANPAEIVNLVIWDCCQAGSGGGGAKMAGGSSAADLGRFSYDQLLGLKLTAENDVSGGGSVFAVDSTKVVVVNSSDAECLSIKTLSRLFDNRTESVGKVPSSEVKMTVVDDPYVRRYSFLLVSSMVYAKGAVIGVVGFELDLAELVAQIMFYSDGGVTSYAFLLDTDGNVIVHPHYVTLPSVRPLMMPVVSVEKRFPYVEWRHSLKSQSSGQVLQLREPAETNRTDLDVVYYWKTVRSTPYVVVIASREKMSVERLVRPEFSGVITRNLAYHRLDLMLSKDFELCFHGRMLASTQRLGLYLAPRCFQNPIKRFSGTESKRTAQGFWAFVSDMTRLITNPGLKLNIRREISALMEMAVEWKRLAKEGEFQNCVVRRYLATPSGVMVTFPAVLINQHYDPVQRDWFQLAVQHPGKVVITGPVMDPSGFGHVVSLSHTVYEGKSAAVHQSSDLVVAVLSIDVPVTFLYKMLHMHVSICREADINCFLFDDRGYIVAYNNMQLQGDVIKRPEGLHITHKEPLIASEILQRSEFVRKVVCMRFSDRSVQRVYHFNTSFTDVIQSSDGCLRYQITSVRQTNVFLAIVNRSCHRQSAFCPCSVTDRRCLNCYRSEATECECPCECSLLYSYCPKMDAKSFSPKQLPMCEAAAEEPLHAQPDGHFFDLASLLPQCMQTTCSAYKTQIACLGVVGCEWCHVDFDRVMPLQQPYCTSVHVCFSGVLGMSPFGNIDQEMLNSKFASSTPVGPVAGGIMGVFVLLVAGVYWYRQQVNRIMESRCYGANDSSAIHLNSELEEEFHFDDGNSNQSNGASAQGSGLLLTSFERQNLITVPRTRSRWRPGSRAESSDPGYSTMTANCEDSEPTTANDILSPGPSSSAAAGLKRKLLSSRAAACAPPPALGAGEVVGESVGGGGGGGKKSAGAMITVVDDDNDTQVSFKSGDTSITKHSQTLEEELSDQKSGQKSLFKEKPLSNNGNELVITAQVHAAAS